jgi:hypothetical protein
MPYYLGEEAKPSKKSESHPNPFFGNRQWRCTMAHELIERLDQMMEQLILIRGHL